VVLFGFIGARAYHVFSDYQLYVDDPIAALYVWRGGLAIYGAVAGGVLGLYFAVRSRTQFWKALAWLTPSVVLGQVIGRFGNFINYELFGYPTNLPWKMFVPVSFRSEAFRDVSFFHPLFLYESLGSLVILIFLLVLERQGVFHKVHAASLFFCYILLYNALRFLLEFLRIDSVLWAGFRFNALVSLALVVASSGAVFYFYVRTRTQHS
jgi:phosphatidylglycerol:prolipoprotein diacylglycerol transferase